MGSGDSEAGSPAIRFPEEQNTGREVSWDEWLSCFDYRKWAFIWQDSTPDGQLSRFCRLVPRFERLADRR